jgi:hypothetical protein
MEPLMGDGAAVALPTAVTARLDEDEPPVASLVGAQGSGLVVTSRRVLRWRPPGATASVRLTAIDHIELHAASRGRPASIVVGSAGEPTLIVSLEQRHVEAVASFIQTLVTCTTRACRANGTPVEVDAARLDTGTVWVFEPLPTSAPAAGIRPLERRLRSSGSVGAG